MLTTRWPHPPSMAPSGATTSAAFISPDVVNAAVVANRSEIPPASGEHYVAFVDVAGGTGGDSYTAASRP